MFLTLIIRAPFVAIAWVFAVLISLTVHEFCHALVATFLGDATAKQAGRLTINPLAHIDFLGVLPMLLLGFGWAKPVPFSAANLRNQRWGPAAVGLAGPTSNLLLALIGSAGLRFLLPSGSLEMVTLPEAFFFFLIFTNLALFFFNLIPLYPLDGSKFLFALFAQPRWETLRGTVTASGPQILLFLTLISFLGYNIFWIITEPTFIVCSSLSGGNCSEIQGWLLSNP